MANAWYDADIKIYVSQGNAAPEIKSTRRVPYLREYRLPREPKQKKQEETGNGIHNTCSTLAPLLYGLLIMAVAVLFSALIFVSVELITVNSKLKTAENRLATVQEYNAWETELLRDEGILPE